MGYTKPSAAAALFQSSCRGVGHLAVSMYMTLPLAAIITDYYTILPSFVKN
ncbi:MAG: hypothetical protein SPI25_06620 [Dialister sp.]|nr:hypothetical protein [Dialister sp.]